MDAAERIDDLPEGGLLYEPRSLWSVQAVEMSSLRQEVGMPRIHFYNGGKHPITLDRVAIHGINYDLAVQSTAQGLPTHASASAVQNAVSLKIGVPFRNHFSRSPVLIDGLVPEPTGLTGPRAAVASAGGTYFPSSNWGLSLLNLSKPLYLPRNAAIESSFSAVRRPDFDAGLDPRGYAVWQQEGGLFAGFSRSFDWPILGQAATSSELSDPVGTVPEQGWPYALTPLQLGYGPVPQTPQFWDPTGHFSSKRFREQEATRAGSSKLTALRVMLDQRQIDDGVSDALGAINPRPTMESLAGKIGTRIRTADGGTKEWWWRPGAPLSLVADTITPATVYKLAMPITLSPEDSLDVRAIIPAIPNLPQATAARTMNIGISFNGFATIEG